MLEQFWTEASISARTLPFDFPECTLSVALADSPPTHHHAALTQACEQGDPIVRVRNLTDEERQQLAQDSGLKPEQLERWLNRRLTATTVEARPVPAAQPEQTEQESDEGAEVVRGTFPHRASFLHTWLSHAVPSLVSLSPPPPPPPQTAVEAELDDDEEEDEEASESPAPQQTAVRSRHQPPSTRRLPAASLSHQALKLSAGAVRAPATPTLPQRRGGGGGV